MGFKRKPKTYNLSFAEGHDLHGLEVKMLSLTVADFVRMASKDDDESAARENFNLFARSLVAWNLEDEDGKPVPTTLEGVESQDFEFILSLSAEWMSAISGVSAPLDGGSNSGGTSLEASIPMET